MKAIIFDFDGVIHDTLDDIHKIHCETLEELTLDELKIKVFGENPRNVFEKYTLEQRTNFDSTWGKCCIELILERNIREALIKLNDDFDLYIITSNTEKNLNAYFENNNFTKIFKKIYGYETHKSKVEKFKLLFQEHNLNKDNSIFITDTLGDILEANQVNIKTIAVDFGFHDKELLEKGNPYKIISTFDEIYEEVDKLR